MAKKKQKPAKPPKNRSLSVLPETLDALNEMDSADDRTAAIVGLAFLENNLALAIMSRLRDMDETEQKDLFDEPLSLLGGFSAKVEIGYALNIFGKSVRSDLKRLNRIRNRFAHYLEVRNFDHPEVSKFCDDLIYPTFKDPSKRTRPQTREEKFRDTISYLAARFTKETKYPHKPPESINRFSAVY
jgi:hypothetical protein